jgi:tetratricopeptide (TPR) repeat protein
MKYFLILIAVFICKFSFAQQMTYQEWKEQAKTEIRMLPEYGNVKKTEGQIAADNELIQAELKQNGTHRKASDKLIKIGFDYLYRGAIKTAMYRFNQAYLLDPKNENIYWGFGSIYFTFNDMNEALRQYAKGLAINPNSSNILTDKASIYLAIFENKGDAEDLNIAIGFFTKSYGIDQLNQNTLFKLSAAYLYNKDCKNAWRFYNECMKLGGKPVTQNYTDALKKMCAN